MLKRQERGRLARDRVALAALANPHNRTIFMAGAVAAGVGLVIFETWALFSYHESTWMQFILREVVALAFLAGFYFSMKTVRAFVMHKVGKRDEAGEFDEREFDAVREDTTSMG